MQTLLILLVQTEGGGRNPSAPQSGLPSGDHGRKDFVQFILGGLGGGFHVGAVGDDILEHLLDDALVGQQAGLGAGPVLEADGGALVHGLGDDGGLVGELLHDGVGQVLLVLVDALDGGQHAHGDGGQELQVVVGLIQVLDEGLADLGVLGVLPHHQRDVGGLGAVNVWRRNSLPRKSRYTGSG